MDVSGLNETRFPRTLEVLRSAVADGVTPGVVAGLWDAREPERISAHAQGLRRLGLGGLTPQAMDVETIFDLASLTKIMATATLAARLVDRGWLRWETPLTAILPSAAGAEEIRIRHLMSHTAGYVAWQPLWEKLREQFGPDPIWKFSVAERQRAMRELVLAIRPDARPDTQAVYSDISFLLLGFALEEVTAMPLERAVRKWVWEPMGLKGLYFEPVTKDAAHFRPRRGRERIAATEDSAWRGGVLQGQVHDDNCWAMGGYAGHAGAFGTVRDVLTFARALPGFLRSETLRACWTPVREPAGCSRTLGWDTPSGDEPSASRRFSPHSVGHLGFTGTSLWIDPEAGIAAALLTNRVHPSRENNLIRGLRPRFHEALRLDLGR